MIQSFLIAIFIVEVLWPILQILFNFLVWQLGPRTIEAGSNMIVANFMVLAYSIIPWWLSLGSWLIVVILTLLIWYVKENHFQPKYQSVL